jgi:hypothetical protein
MAAIFIASYFPAGYLQTVLRLGVPAWRFVLMIGLTFVALAIGSFFMPFTAAERAELDEAVRAVAEVNQPRCRRCETPLPDVSLRCSACGATQVGGILILCMAGALAVTLALLFSGTLR